MSRAGEVEVQSALLLPVPAAEAGAILGRLELEPASGR